MIRVVGVDLAVKRKSTAAFLVGCELLGVSNYWFPELIELIIAWRPNVVAVDAPLSEPPTGSIQRDVEVIARRIGLRLLPPGMGPMRLLTKLGIAMVEALSGISEVIEVHPSSSAKLLRIDRRRLAQFFNNTDAADAYLSALTGLSYALGLFESIKGLILPLSNPCESIRIDYVDVVN